MQIPEKIILVSPFSTKRLEYAARFISTRMGIDLDIALSDQFNPETVNPLCLVLQYGTKPGNGKFNIYACGLLSETGIKKQETGIFRKKLQTFLFPAPDGFSLPFDIFSAAFYLISRYEEYLPFSPDLLGRFEADQSLAYHHGFLEEPVIDQWTDLLKSKLQHAYPQFEFPVQKYRYISTIDIDNPCAFLHKGLYRTAGGLLKAILKNHENEFFYRIDVLKGKIQDPFDTFQYIRAIEKQYGFNSLFFFLTGDYGGFDNNYALKSKYFKDLVQNLTVDRSIGIHPSYRSHLKYELLKKEYTYFSGILGHLPDKSRQHFLILRFPDSYRQLIALGVRADYSMGYASSVGFRAGTSSPFHFYDLLKECETELVIHPFSVMEVTLRQYLSLTPGEALEKIKKIALKLKKVGGTFTSLWHNESLSEYGVWKGWRAVFEGMMEDAGTGHELRS